MTAENFIVNSESGCALAANNVRKQINNSPAGCMVSIGGTSFQFSSAKNSLQKVAKNVKKFKEIHTNFNFYYNEENVLKRLRELVMIFDRQRAVIESFEANKNFRWNEEIKNRDLNMLHKHGSILEVAQAYRLEALKTLVQRGESSKMVQQGRRVYNVVGVSKRNSVRQR